MKNASRARDHLFELSPRRRADFTSASSRVENGVTHFEVLKGGKKIEEIAMQLSGLHNMANALAVWIECRELGIPSERISEGLEELSRRQAPPGSARRGERSHWSSTISPIIRRRCARRFARFELRYPGKRLVAVFEPRSATSRRKVFQKDYVEAFREADAAFIASPYDQSRIAARRSVLE